MSASPNALRQKIDEIHFLADNFGIPLRRAAALIADPQELDKLSSLALLEERERDPLADVPVPDPQKHPEHLEKDISDLEKPVRHDDSAPT
jgi:hypothetical protein